MQGENLMIVTMHEPSMERSWIKKKKKKQTHTHSELICKNVWVPLMKTKAFFFFFFFEREARKQRDRIVVKCSVPGLHEKEESLIEM